MMNKTTALIVLAIGAVLAFLLWFSRDRTAPALPAPFRLLSADYRNGAYEIDRVIVTLLNGHAEIEIAPGAASRIVIRYFGNEAWGDLDGDGRSDVAFLLTRSAGGSGTFYYAVAALKVQGGYVGTNAVLLGDRIAPQTTEIRNGQLVVNYADRQPGEPMSAPPSVGVSKFLRVANDRLVE